VLFRCARRVNYTRAAVAAVFCARDANRWQH
jgi:hypothetical protein